ncbi:MAG: hypothetical protein K1W16_16385 [Lachnospiraceae bacterium]|jgi:hypothetical protein
MKYAVVEMEWSVGMRGKRLRYSVSEIAAISLDEDLHTIDTFRFLLEQSNGYVRSEQHFEQGKVLVAEQKEGWEKFQEWYSGHDCLVLWNKELREIIVHFCPKIDEKSKKRLKTVYVQKLFDSMTAGVPMESDRILWAVEMLRLRCEAEQLNRPLYYAQLLVRLFRKLCTAGKKEMGALFFHGLIEEDYFYISQYTFFPQLSKRLQQEQNQQIQKQMKEAGYDGKVAKDGVVFVETGISCWKFKLSENVIVLHYTTKSLYRGVRTLCLEFEQSATWEEKLHQILQKISETDEKFQFGVGSLKVQQMIEQIAVKFCHLCD